jgi:hypothetical protein
MDHLDRKAVRYRSDDGGKIRCTYVDMLKGQRGW